MRSASVHDQENEVGGLAADLESNAAALERHHRRRAPRAGVMLAGAAGHGSASVTAANHKSGLENRRVNHHAFRLVEQVLRNVVGNIENLFENGAAILQSFR